MKGAMFWKAADLLLIILLKSLVARVWCRGAAKQQLRKQHTFQPGTVFQDIVDHLESTRQALTAEQLKKAVHHNITGSEELFKQVRSNPKIRLTNDSKYEYKASLSLYREVIFAMLLTLLLPPASDCFCLQRAPVSLRCPGCC